LIICSLYRNIAEIKQKTEKLH